MATVTNRKFCGRNWVNIYEEWEVAFWLKELDCTRSQLEKAVFEVGTSAVKVDNYLHSKHSFQLMDASQKNHSLKEFMGLLFHRHLK